MNHKVIRIVLGTMLCIAAAIQFTRANYLESVLYLLAGITFLISGFMIGKRPNQ